MSCADPQRCATSGELAEHHMQPARGLGAQRGQVMVTVGEEPQASRCDHHDLTVRRPQ